jgi:hypothetical protein
LENKMILQNPMQVASSTIQNTYGAILSSTNKTADTTPTSAVSNYAVQPAASSPVLSAFFQTLSQINLPSTSSSNTQSTASSSANVPQTQVAFNNPIQNQLSSNDATSALQAFTYALFQNLNASSSPTAAKSSALSSGTAPSGGLTPLSPSISGNNGNYINSLPLRLNSLSAAVKSSTTSSQVSLDGLKASFASLMTSLNSGSNASATNSVNAAQLSSFIDKMSQNLMSQNVTSIQSTGSLLDTKA